MSFQDKAAVRPAPRFLFVDINMRCNLRCQHCMYWQVKQGDPPDLISIERRNEIIREFATMSDHGAVVICGGEILLDPDRFYAVTQTCRASGLRCLAVNNGTMIANATAADRLIEQGPSEVTISLNSHRREVHDETRGVVGSFDKAVRALRLLLDSRQRHGGGPKIYAMAVMCERNYRDLDAFYDFVLNDIGADKLKLNFLQPTFGPPTWWYRDRFFQQNIIRDEEELARIIRACDAKYGLRINPVWLKQVQMYHRSIPKSALALLGWRALRGTTEHICNSYERNIMVSLNGTAGLCFNPVFPGVKLQQVGDLRRFWETSDPLRKRMSRCNRYCAISHSVRKESATLKD